MRKFGVNHLNPVGRSFNENIWVHKDYAHLLDGRYLKMSVIEKRAKELPKDFNYTIIRYERSQVDDYINVSFIHSPDFDTARDPKIGSSWCIKGPSRILNGDKHSFRRLGKCPMVYHHKWMYVDFDYQNFDYYEAEHWSEQWFDKVDSNAGIKLNYKTKWDQFLSDNNLPVENSYDILNV